MAINKMMQQPQIIIKDEKKKPVSKKILNTLKLLHAGKNDKKFIIEYTKKDGSRRKWEIDRVIETKDTFCVIQTSDLEFKRLLIENIDNISEKEIEKNAKVSK
jgi:hypothetical protein